MTGPLSAAPFVAITRYRCRTDQVAEALSHTSWSIGFALNERRWIFIHPGEVIAAQGSAEEVGLSLVVLSLVFACAALIRRWTSPLRKLFIPTAVTGGFLVLGLGPEGLGRLIGRAGVFPEHVFAVWRQLPVLFVTVMSASLLLGEHLIREFLARWP